MSIKKRLKIKFPSLVLGGGEGSSESEIHQAEIGLNVKFPNDYYNYLRQFGWLTVDHYEFFGLGPGVPSFLDLKKIVPDEWISGGVPNYLLPIWNNGGGDLDCIDLKLSDNNTSVISSYYHDSQQVEKIAEGVENWLSAKLESLADDD